MSNGSTQASPVQSMRTDGFNYFTPSCQSAFQNFKIEDALGCSTNGSPNLNQRDEVQKLKSEHDFAPQSDAFEIYYEDSTRPHR